LYNVYGGTVKTARLGELAEMVQQYRRTKLRNVRRASGLDNHQTNSEFEDRVEDELRGSGISIVYDDSNFPLVYVLSLPMNLQQLNQQLGLLDGEQLRDGEEFYLPPIPVIEALDETSCNAGAIQVKDRTRQVRICCENYGHALGFLECYVRRLR